MNQNEIVKIVKKELDRPTVGFVEQFLEIHEIEKNGEEPVIVRIEARKREKTALVYLAVKKELFYFLIWIDLKSKKAVWADTIKGLINYEQFCGIGGGTEENPLKEITPQELQQLIESNTDFQLIDVREPYEFEIANLQGELYPLSSVSSYAGKIARDKMVVVHCKGGVRSAKAIRELEDNFGFDNLYNLKGGILAFPKEVDNAIPTY